MGRPKPVGIRAYPVGACPLHGQRPTSRGSGDTPLVDLRVPLLGEQVRLSLKLEGCNRLGSIKERAATAMLGDLERRGLLVPGACIVESSSGNLAVALASLCRERGVRFLAVADPKMTAENLRRLRAVDAEVLIVEEGDRTGGYLLTRLATVRRLLAEHPSYLWTNQYANPANPLAHYQGTAPEILEQSGGSVDAVFVAVSTGGTMAGIGRFFRQHQPSTRLVAVDVEGSVALGASSPRARHLPGLGSSLRSKFLTADSYDAAVIVREGEAYQMCHRLYRDTGLMLGGSGGAVVAGCLSYLAVHRGIRRPVCVCADRGEDYRSSIYDPAWAAEVGIKPVALDLALGHFEWVSNPTQDACPSGSIE